MIYLSQHARKRVGERLSMTDGELSDLITMDAYVLLYEDTDWHYGNVISHCLFHSPKDSQYFVFLLAKIEKVVITILPETMYSRVRIGEHALTMARNLVTEQDTVVRYLLMYYALKKKNLVPHELGILEVSTAEDLASVKKKAMAIVRQDALDHKRRIIVIYLKNLKSGAMTRIDLEALHAPA